MAAFAKIDKALNLYYRAVGRYDYYNNEGIGKFVQFCDENGVDVEDIDDELDDLNNCLYIEFDDNFPFIDKDKDKDIDTKNSIIFDIIKSCYHNGSPPDKYRPKKKNLTLKKTSSFLVDAFIRDLSKQCIDIDGKPIFVPTKIHILCTKYESNKYLLMASYDFDVDLEANDIISAERIFANIYMYHSKLPNREDYESLAISYKNNGFPFLFYILESFDRDRIRRGCHPEFKYLTLKDWMIECDFLNEYILQELDKKSLFNSIEKVCNFYIRKWKNKIRVLPSKMEMERMYIKDDLYEITDIILAIYRFVKELYFKYPNGTKFQCEFCIAIRSTIKEILTTAMVPDIDGDIGDDIDINITNIDNEDDDDDTDKYIHYDKIGNFTLNMKENGIPYIYEQIIDRNEIDKYLFNAWNRFKELIDSEKYTERPSTFGNIKTNEEKQKYYKPFPNRRRFCCFIDRREYFHETSFKKKLKFKGKEKAMMDNMDDMDNMNMFEWIRTDKKIRRNINLDEFTFFIPDDQYLPNEENDKLENKIYIESYLDLLHLSMIPELRIFDDEKEEKHLVSDRINGINSLNGSLFNIQFQCERYDEIRIYIYWNNQCLRLYPNDFWLVLPRLFVKEYKNNKKYPNDPKIKEKINKNFKFGDKYFDYFYKSISIYNQQKKEWIDKPTNNL